MTATHVTVLAVAGLLGAVVGRVVDSAGLHALHRARVERATRDAGPPAGVTTTGPALAVDHAPPARAGRLLGSPWPELVGAAATVLVIARFGAHVELVAWLWFAALGLLVALVDLHAHLILNRVLVPGTGVAVALLALAALATGDGAALGRGCLAGLLVFAGLLAMALISPAGLGMGDVKLGALLGLYLGWLGWATVLPGLLVGFVLQAVLGLGLLLLRRVGLRAELPFGPALLVGTLAVALGAGAWAWPLV